MTTKYSKCASGPAMKKMADGGSVGLFDRLKAGNIDQEGSEAFNRFGAGAKAARENNADYDSALQQKVKYAPNPAPEADASAAAAEDDTPAYRSEGDRPKSAAPAASRPAVKRTAAAPAKAAPATKSSAAPDYGNENRRTVSAPAAEPAEKASFYSNASKNAPDMDPQNYIGKIKSMFDMSRFKPSDKVATTKYVDGGMIGANTVNSVKKSALLDPNFKDNALGGGRAGYGKK